jgi:ketosteroid isomerase-like protein
MRILITLLLIIGSATSYAQAQSTEDDIKAVIETLFDGMRAGDSSMVASAFTRDAVMQSVAVNREGEVVKMQGSLPQFLTSIGTPREQVLDERIASYDIKIDGDLASVWTPYQFYIGEQFSHCGVNSFQMARLDGEWKIVYIIDTRRRTNCVEG